jgi:hypothetical protein
VSLPGSGPQGERGPEGSGPQAAGTVAFCRVVATVTHQPAGDRVRIWIGLPLEGWNGRFLGLGGGQHAETEGAEARCHTRRRGHGALDRGAAAPPGITARYRVRERSPYLIGDLPGFTPQVSRLVSMMNHVRSTTLAAVDGLRVDALDYLHDPQSNSVGTLLAHIAAAEVGYQAHTFEAREWDAAERQEWGAALELGERASRLR